MGFFKKIFKPVSKVLDKIIPNEIKPILPYAAAFAPMFAPGIMGAFGGSALSRAAIGGGLNIFDNLHKKVTKVILICCLRDSERCQVL